MLSKSKERLQKEVHERYYVLSEEETNREHPYACKQFRKTKNVNFCFCITIKTFCIFCWLDQVAL